MKVFKIFIILFLTNWSFVNGQTPFVTGEFTDNRDGKKYQTITIDKVIWLAENMKFKTENATTSVKNNLGGIMDGYYYLMEESDKVCPTGFRIPKIKEWEAYVQFYIKLKDIPTSSIDYTNYTNKKGEGRFLKASNDKLQFFKAPNPLNLRESGMIQGSKFIEDGAMSFWIRKGASADFKYHLHLEPNTFSNHSHKHHIIAKKKKKRKFVVRCIKNDLEK